MDLVEGVFDERGCDGEVGFSERAGGKIPLHPQVAVTSKLGPFALRCAKGKKDKKQKSRGNPDQAEAYIVVRVGRIAVVPIRNGAVVGIVVPATAAFHTVRTAC